MAQYNFGVGQLCLIPPGTNQTPVQVGTLKDVSVDISRDVKELMGSQAFAVDIALGKGKISGKAKSGQIQSSVIAAILAGSTVTTGQILAANNEMSVIPATPFTVTALNGATFKQDMGVYDYTAGKWLTVVASAPATGQYSINTITGAYLFAAADTTHSVGLYYLYTATTGVTTSLSNPLMGAATVFQVIAFNTYRGKQKGFKLYAAVFPKLSMGDKQEDYTEVDLEFSCFADANNKVIDLYTAE